MMLSYAEYLRSCYIRLPLLEDTFKQRPVTPPESVLNNALALALASLVFRRKASHFPISPFLLPRVWRAWRPDTVAIREAEMESEREGRGGWSERVKWREPSRRRPVVQEHRTASDGETNSDPRAQGSEPTGR